MITEDYVSFETAKLLKEKGYKGSFNSYYNNAGCVVDKPNVLLKEPEYQYYERVSLYMVMKWLREVHKIGVFPTTFYRHTETFDGHNYGCTLVNLKTFDVIGNFEDCTFPADSYEQTCEAAIKYCLENLI